MTDSNLTYEAALSRVQNLVAELEDGSMNLDELSAKLAEAKKLLEFCRIRLQQTESEINNLLTDGEK